MEDNNRTFEFAARFASEKEILRYTRFLDPAQAVEAGKIAREHGVQFMTWGGYDAAERVIGCIPNIRQNSVRFPIAICWDHLWL